MCLKYIKMNRLLLKNILGLSTKAETNHSEHVEYAEYHPITAEYLATLNASLSEVATLYKEGREFKSERDIILVTYNWRDMRVFSNATSKLRLHNYRYY